MAVALPKNIQFMPMLHRCRDGEKRGKPMYQRILGSQNSAQEVCKWKRHVKKVRKICCTISKSLTFIISG